MRIITITCPNCGTITAGNVLEKQREMRCPSLSCDYVLRFANLDEADREHILTNRENYTMD